MTVYDEETAVLRGLDTVRINKEALVEIVTKNRDEHRQAFEEAIEGWKTEAIRQLERAVEDAKAGREFAQRVAIRRPQDHTREYNQVLKMLEMSLDTELELTARDFSRFVMDEWEWQGDFLRTAAAYGSTTASGKFDN